MKKILYITALIVILTVFVLNIFQFKNEELIVHYNSFKKEATLRNVKIPNKKFHLIYFSLLDKEEYGRVAVNFNIYIIPTIIIVNSNLKELDDEYKESILYHEFGHLFFNKPHNNELDKNISITFNDKKYYKSKSIMYFGNRTLLFYKKHRKEYLDEFFKE